MDESSFYINASHPVLDQKILPTMSSSKRNVNLELNKKDFTEVTSNPLVIKIIHKWAIALGCWIIISLMGNIIQLTVQYGIFNKTYAPTRDYFVSVAFLMAISMTSSVLPFAILLLFVFNVIGNSHDLVLMAIRISTLISLIVNVLFTLLIAYELK